MQRRAAYHYVRSWKFSMRSASEHEPGPGRQEAECEPGSAEGQRVMRPRAVFAWNSAATGGGESASG